jgi:hypothetical protein
MDERMYSNRPYYPEAPDYEEPFMSDEQMEYLEGQGNHSYEPRVVEAPIKKDVPKKEDNLIKSKKYYKLKKPIEFEGEYVEEVYTDFDILTGRDTIEASSHATGATLMMEFDRGFLAAIVAKSIGKPFDFMQYLCAKDFMELTNRAAGFLI